MKIHKDQKIEIITDGLENPAQQFGGLLMSLITRRNVLEAFTKKTGLIFNRVGSNTEETVAAFIDFIAEHYWNKGK
jgi:hypothetical protein